MLDVSCQLSVVSWQLAVGSWQVHLLQSYGVRGFLAEDFVQQLFMTMACRPLS